MTNTLLTTKQAATYLGVSCSFLEKDRWRGARINFVRISARAIRYRLEELDNYILEQTMQSTSEYAA